MILDDTLDAVGSRTYLNDAAKADVVVAAVASLLTLVADIAFERRSPSKKPEALFGPPSEGAAWHDVLAKLNRVGNGPRLEAQLRSHHDMAVQALGFGLWLPTDTSGSRGFDWQIGATAGPTVARPAGTSDRLCQRGDADGAHRLLAEPDAVLPAQQFSNWLRRLFG